MMTPSDLQSSSYRTKAKFSHCFFTYSKYFQTLKGENELFVFLLTKNNTTSSPGFSVHSLIICSGLNFQHKRFNMTAFFLNLVNSLAMVNYA